MKKMVSAFFLLGLLLAACTSAIQTLPVDRKTPLPRGLYATPPAGETVATPTPLLSEIPAAAMAAQADLAQLLGVDSSTVVVLLSEAGQWPDSCLGLGRADEMCAQQVIEGYQVTLHAVGAIFTYRTNQDGSNLRIAFPDIGDAQAPVLVARAVLAGQLGMSDPSQVALVQALPVYWSDACLGMSSADIACAEVITPGFRILLEAQGHRYVFHANQDGSQVIQVESPLP